MSAVRIHTGQTAARTAAALGADAFTVGSDIGFARNRYRPNTEPGRQLLSHELVHVAQQHGRGPGRSDPEAAAAKAGHKLGKGQTVDDADIGSAATGLYLQESEGAAAAPTPQPRPITMPWAAMGQLGQLVLEEPTLQVPGRQRRRPSLGVPRLRRPVAPRPDPLDTSAVGSGTPGQQNDPIGPDSPARSTPAAAPALPSRLSRQISGQFSLGVRLGFPELPGPSESVTRAITPPADSSHDSAIVLDSVLGGSPPSTWDTIDKGQLAGIIWSILSTQIAPELGSIASRLSPSTGTASGVNYELDLLILTTFDGGGASFTVTW